MVQNQGTDAMVGLNPHTQRSNLPGASAAGAACAKAADLFPRVSDLGVAIDVWMAGMYHRRPMLDPQLERIGVGCARLPDGMLTAALRFENVTRRGGTWPLAYPADKQTDVLLDYGAEFPNPIPNHGTGGYAITLQFPPFDKVTGVTAKLADAKGNPVQFFLSDPEHPATSFGQFGGVRLRPLLARGLPPVLRSDCERGGAAPRTHADLAGATRKVLPCAIQDQPHGCRLARRRWRCHPQRQPGQLPRPCPCGHPEILSHCVLLNPPITGTPASAGSNVRIALSH